MLKDAKMNCMTLIAGKDISASGRVLAAHNEDDPGHVVVHHAYVPPQDYPEGERMPAEEGRARIPQVPHTLGYYWVEFLQDQGGLTSADAFLNDCGVVITSNSMGYSREDPEDASLVKEGGLGYTLRRALAERAHTAREGAGILQALIAEWGYGPSGRAYTIADQNEAFMFQLVRGRHYVGARIPDRAVAVMPNHYNFHTLQDVPEMFYPSDVIRYAVSKGWYIPKDEACSDFDFAKAYQDERTAGSPGNMLRQKHGQRLVLGRDWDLETEGIPFVVYPERPVSLDTFREVMMTHYEGTEDDRERFGPGQSPHNCPDTRRICTGTSLECQLWEFQDRPEDTCVYTSLGRPCQVPLLPLHPLRGLPEEILEKEETAQQMAKHLQPHPGVTAASDTVTDRFRRLCGAEEMLFCDVSGAVRKELDGLYLAAKQENELVQLQPEQALERDTRFLHMALEHMEQFSENHFRCVPMEVSGNICLSQPEGRLRVLFECGDEPVESSLVFGLEFTNVRDAFAPALEGTLRKLGEHHYSADFAVAPMMKMLPIPGIHTFWLGGRTEKHQAFAGSAVLPVRESFPQE